MGDVTAPLTFKSLSPPQTDVVLFLNLEKSIDYYLIS